MKTLQFSIIVGAGIVITIFSSLVFFGGYDIFQTENFHVVKIEKLADYERIWSTISTQPVDQKNFLVTGDHDWSHNGKFVAFNMGGGAPTSYLYTMDADGKEIAPANIPIMFNSVDNIRISPDDNSVYFIGQYNIKNETYQDIFRYYLNNQSYSLITKDSSIHGFDFLPDGNLVYLETHSNATRLEKSTFLIHSYAVLWLATSDGNKIKPIHNGTQLFEGMAASPDGDRIVFASTDDPLHPSSNGTDVIDFGSLGGPIRNNQPFYLAIFDMNTKEFTIIKTGVNGEFWNLKWISDDQILYETLTNHCVQDKTLGEQSCPAGLLRMMNLSDHSSQLLYGNQVEPYTAPLVGAAISPDKRSLIFGINFDYSNGQIDGKGIYQMTFDKPLYSK